MHFFPNSNIVLYHDWLYSFVDRFTSLSIGNKVQFRLWVMFNCATFHRVILMSYCKDGAKITTLPNRTQNKI